MVGRQVQTYQIIRAFPALHPPAACVNVRCEEINVRFDFLKKTARKDSFARIQQQTIMKKAYYKSLV
jgi:hypothetical protein